MSQKEALIQKFQELSMHVKVVLTILGLLFLLFIMLLAYLQFGIPVIELLGIYTSMVLTAALVALYFRQTRMLEAQTKIMEFHKKVEESQLRPKPHFRINDLNNGYLGGTLQNKGEGVGTDFIIEIRRKNNSQSSQRFSITVPLLNEDGYRIGTLRPGDEMYAQFKPKFPVKKSNEIESLSFEEFNKAEAVSDGGSVQLRIGADTVAGDTVHTTMFRVVNITDENDSLEMMFGLA